MNTIIAFIVLIVWLLITMIFTITIIPMLFLACVDASDDWMDCGKLLIRKIVD